MTVQPDSHQDRLTVQLEKMIYGGDALGRLSDGRAAFVPFGLPGEMVKARIVDEKRGHVRAELVEVLEPSPERILPKCAHFGVCGGCHYQHISSKIQLQVKTDILRDQLSRIGKVPNPPMGQMVASSLEWNYRNHVQFHLTREGKLGYMGANNRGVVPIFECHLPETALNGLWPSLEFDPGLGLERISLRVGTNGETMLVLESDNLEPPELELEAALSVVHLAGDDMVVMAGDDAITMAVKDRAFHVSACLPPGGSSDRIAASTHEDTERHADLSSPVDPRRSDDSSDLSGSAWPLAGPALRRL